MKKLLILLVILHCSLALFSQVIVDGYAYLNGETEHDSIMVIFEQTAPGNDIDTAYTQSNGYYSISLGMGFYDVTFMKRFYFDSLITSQQVTSDLTLQNVELESVGLHGDLSGTIISGSYDVFADIYIRESDTLIIEGGTKLYFNTDQKLIVEGMLVVEGTINDTVLFSKQNNYWGGLEITASADSNSVIKYLVLEYSDDIGIDIQSSIEIHNSIFRYNRSDKPYGAFVAGGMKIINSSPIINDCQIINNTMHVETGVGGHGVFLDNSNSVFTRCIISSNGGNTQRSTVGGVYVYSGLPQFRNCLINKNSTFCCGTVFSGIYSKTATKFINCIINENYFRGGTRTVNAGGIYINCLFYKNKSSWSTTCNSYAAVSGTLYNCIITESIACYGTGNVPIENSIVVNNVCGDFINPDLGLGSNYIENTNGDSCDFYYNVFLDPLFVDPENGDFRLLPGSPAIDAGANENNTDAGDMDGNIRIWDGNGDGDAIIDIGPYEYGAPFLAESDVSVQSLYWPLSGCGLTEDEEIRVLVKNFGTVGEKNFSVSYSIDGGTSFVTDVYSDSLPPGETGNFSFSQSADFSSLGDYNLIVAISADGDETSENDTLRKTISHYQLTADISDSMNISCFDGSDGEAIVEATGAPGPYYYQWDDDFARNTPTVTGLSANVLYTVDVITGDRCQASASVMLSQPEKLTMNLLELNKATCNSGMDDGSVIVEALGGAPPFVFEWDDESLTTGPTLENMTPNIWYHLLINDVLGCTAYDSVKVTEANKLITSFPGVSNTSCFGSEDGSAEVAVYFGTEPYAYQWDDPDGSETKTITDLEGDRYYRVCVIDALGCSAYDSIFIEEPDSIKTSFVLVHNKCYGDKLGGINMTVIGGTENYTYDWSNGSTVEDIVDLAADKFIVEITDANECVHKDSVDITQPDSIVLEIDIHEVSCFGLGDGGIIVTPSGGTPTYSYEWEDGSDHYAIGSIPSGQYLLKLTDANGCMLEENIVVPQPDLLGVSFVQGDFLEICEDDEVILDLSITGGTEDFLIQWDGVEGTEHNTFPAEESKTIDVTVNDAQSCMAETSIDIQVNKPYADEEICIVTVNSEGNNMVVWEKTLDVGVVQYNVWKQTDETDVYEVIGSVPVGEPSVFIDQDSDPAKKSDWYRISSVDTCGNDSPPSPFHKTIHLAVSPSVPQGYNLAWDHIEIENDNGEYNTYFIYRGSSYENMELIESVSSITNQTLDQNPPAGQVLYQVSAKKLDACDPGSNKKGVAEAYGESFSNLEDVVNTGRELYGVGSDLRIYPNPLKESTIIEFSNTENHPYRLRITDMTGKVVRKEGVITGERYELKRQGLQPGIYFIELIGEELYRGSVIVR